MSDFIELEDHVRALHRAATGMRVTINDIDEAFDCEKSESVLLEFNTSKDFRPGTEYAKFVSALAEMARIGPPSELSERNAFVSKADAIRNALIEHLGKRSAP